LPIEGADAGQWGAILNDYLSQAHNADGTLKTDSVSAAQLANSSVKTASISDGNVTEIKLSADVVTKLNTPGLGATGPQGAAGAQGAVGATGATGPQGIQGPIGFTGSQGATGTAGLNGIDGVTGFTGPQGPAGTNGIDGPTGPIGATGPQGLTGPQGIQGITGFTGAQGATGTAGLNGTDGATGATGLQGVMGATGPVGPGDMAKSTYDPALKNAQLAADSEVVHNTGTETVAGSKTFSSTIAAAGLTIAAGRLAVNTATNTTATSWVQGTATAAEWVQLFTANGVTPANATAISAVQNKAISLQAPGGAFYHGRDSTNNIEFVMGTSATGVAWSGSVTTHAYELRTNNTTRLSLGNGTLATWADGESMAFGTTTGTKFGTATTQKLSFYNSTPIVQPSGNIVTALTNLGLVASPTISSAGVLNRSVSSQTGFSADTYLTGSNTSFTANAPKVGTEYRCKFDVTKTAAGTATPIISLRIGTAGTTADTARCTFTFGAGTTDVDTGLFEVVATFRTVGSGTTAVVQATATLVNNLTTLGISNAVKCVVNTSSGFDSSTPTVIGLSYNAGTSASHTIQMVNATLLNLT